MLKINAKARLKFEGPLRRSAQPSHLFDGTWLNNDGQLLFIQSSKIQEQNCEFFVRNSFTVLLNKDGVRFSGSEVASNGKRKIQWNDGDTWIFLEDKEAMPRLRQELRNLIAENRDIKSTLYRQQQDHRSLTNEIVSLKTRIKWLHAIQKQKEKQDLDLSKKKVENAALQHKVEDLQSLLRSKNEELRRKVRMSSQNLQAKKDLAAETKNHKQTKQEVEKWKQRARLVEEKWEDCNVKLRRIVGKQADAMRSTEVQLGKVEQLKLEISEMKEDNAKLQTQLEDSSQFVRGLQFTLRDTISSLESRLEQGYLEIHNFKQEISNLKIRIEDLQSQLVVFEERHQYDHKQYQELQCKFKNLYIQKQVTLTAETDDIMTAIARLREANSLIEQQKADLIHQKKMRNLEKQQKQRLETLYSLERKERVKMEVTAQKLQQRNLLLKQAMEKELKRNKKRLSKPAERPKKRPKIAPQVSTVKEELIGNPGQEKSFGFLSWRNDFQNYQHCLKVPERFPRKELEKLEVRWLMEYPDTIFDTDSGLTTTKTVILDPRLQRFYNAAYKIYTKLKKNRDRLVLLRVVDEYDRRNKTRVVHEPRPWIPKTETSEISEGWSLKHQSSAEAIDISLPGFDIFDPIDLSNIQVQSPIAAPIKIKGEVVTARYVQFR